MRLAAENGGSATTVDVHIRSVAIRADELGEARVPPPKIRWWRWLIGIVMVLTLADGAMLLAVNPACLRLRCRRLKMMENKDIVEKRHQVARAVT